MDVHLGIRSSRDEDPIPRVRQELRDRGWTLTWRSPEAAHVDTLAATEQELCFRSVG